DDVRHVRVIEPGERLRLFHERREDPLPLDVVRVLERLRLRDLEDEEAIGARLPYEPHRSDAALSERLDQLVTLDELRLLLLRLRRRRRRAPDRALDRALEEGGRD